MSIPRPGERLYEPDPEDNTPEEDPTWKDKLREAYSNNPTKFFAIVLIIVIVVLALLVILAPKGEEPTANQNRVPVPVSTKPVMEPLPDTTLPPEVVESGILPDGTGVDAVGPGDTSDDRTQLDRENTAMNALVSWRNAFTNEEGVDNLKATPKLVQQSAIDSALNNDRADLMFPSDLVDRYTEVMEVVPLNNSDVVIRLAITDTMANDDIIPYEEEWIVSMDNSTDPASVVRFTLN